MPITPFNPPNMGASMTSPEPQHATHFLYVQPVYPIRIHHAIDLTIEESQRDKMV